MPRKTIDGATITYAAADEETAREIVHLYTDARGALRDRWGIEPTRALQIRSISNWWRLGTGASLVTTCVNRFFWPMHWYSLSFCGNWNHFYAAAWVRDARRRGVNVKTLCMLPPELPPQLRASFVHDEAEIDRPSLWRHQVAGALVAAWYFDTVPAWIVGGLQEEVARQIVDAPWREPHSWQPIMKWAGYAPMEFDIRNVGKLDQNHVDELVGRVSWPRWSVKYIEEVKPGLLGAMVNSGCPKQQYEARLAEALGLPPPQFWGELASRVVLHYEGQPPKGVPGAAVDVSENPFASPGAVPPAKKRRSFWSGSRLGMLVLGWAGGMYGGLKMIDLLGKGALGVVAAVVCVLGGMWLGVAFWVGGNVLVDVARGRR